MADCRRLLTITNQSPAYRQGFFFQQLNYFYILISCIPINISLTITHFKIMTLSDVECDHMNAQSCCNSLNFWVTPKIGAHGFIVILLLLGGKFFLLAINAPVLAWQIHQVITLPAGSMGVFDPTEIHTRGMVRRHQKHCLLSASFFLGIFFIYLYW